MTEGLLTAYRGVVCDLDGVVYRGPAAVPGAVAALTALAIPVVYATNNASRPPEAVAEHLRELGLAAGPETVVNSSMAGAAELAASLPAGSTVLAVGGAGVALALAEAGLSPVTHAREPVAAVLQGFGPEVRAADLAEAAYAIAGGARWVATNVDLTLPTDRGIAPGNGSLVRCVELATGQTPHVVGKPEAPLYLMSCQVLGLDPSQVLAVGDRLETDISGAYAAGMASALVLTGVHGVRDAAIAPVPERPTFVISDLGELASPYAAVTRQEGGFACGNTRVRVTGGHLEIDAGANARPIESVRAGLAAIWSAIDAEADIELGRALAAYLPDRV